MSRNITVDPLARALAVEIPQIKEVMNWRTGKYWNVRDFITRRRHQTIVVARNKLREDMAEGRSRLQCAYCPSDVYLVASTNKAFFFRHRVENGDCPAVTRHSQSEAEVRASKYAGAQESESHQRIKELLIRSINADPHFAEAAKERRWKGIERPGRYRKPDVSAKLGDLWIAFEAQLSTTFISVVAERRAFYRAEGGLLVWTLADFNPEDRRLTVDDMLFPNNSNIFVVDDETAAASEATQRFMLKCHYRVPNVISMTGGAVWDVKLVGFDELKIDREGQRVFLVDVEGEEREHRQKLEEKRAEDRRLFDAALRDEFLSIAACPHDEFPPYEEVKLKWQDFIRRFGQIGITLPPYGQLERDFYQPIKALMSAREGVPTGWKYLALIEINHHLYNAHKPHLLTYGFGIQAYGRKEKIMAQDDSRKWAPKARKIKAAIAAKDPAYEPALEHFDLLHFLFPEPMALMDQFLAHQRKSA